MAPSWKHVTSFGDRVNKRGRACLISPEMPADEERDYGKNSSEA
jgi:hypothetical protein